MDSSNTLQFLIAVFLIIGQSIIFADSYHCPCRQMIIEDKNPIGFKYEFKWHSRGSRGHVYQELNSDQYLVKDEDGRWGIGRKLDGIDPKYFAADPFACPRLGGQTWHSLANSLENGYATYNFDVKCKEYFGYLGANSNLICTGNRRIAEQNLAAAIKKCNEMEVCEAVRQWEHKSTLFHTCTGTYKHTPGQGIVYVKGYAGYKKKTMSGKLWCHNLLSSNTVFEDIPTAIQKCNQENKCVGVKVLDVDADEEKVMVCKRFDRITRKSTNGIIYKRKCGPKNGKKCKFPFIHNSKSHLSCTSDPLIGVGFWCSNTSFHRGAISRVECVGLCENDESFVHEVSTSLADGVEINTSQTPNTSSLIDKSVMDIYGAYIYGGCGLFLLLMASAIIIACVIKRKHRMTNIECPAGDTRYEDDGYDYIGQLDMIQPNEGTATDVDPLPMNENTVLVSQNPYYEESLELNEHDDPNSLIQTGTRMASHITMTENPYYEGI